MTSKLATSSVFAQYKQAASADTASSERRDVDEAGSDVAVFSPSEATVDEPKKKEEATAHEPREGEARPGPEASGAAAAAGTAVDEWDVVSRHHETRVAESEGAPPPISQPIQYGEAFMALRSNEASWRAKLPEIKRVADHVKDQGAIWKCLWACMHNDIKEESEDAADRDFLLCLAATEFDHGDAVHRRMLWTIHRRVVKPRRSEPDVPLVGPHWAALGFQGVNPATDLRSNGMLGLLQMLFLLEYYPPFAAALWGSARSPLTEFPFALLTLAYTGVTLEALRDKALYDDICARRKKLATTKQPQQSTAIVGEKAAGRGAVGSMAGGIHRVDVACPVADAMNAFYVGCLFSFLKEWKQSDVRAITELPPIRDRLRKYARENAAVIIKRGEDARKREAIAGLGNNGGDEGARGGGGGGGKGGEKLEFHTF